MIDKETRYNVPRLWSHLVSSHDVLWTWEEELHIPIENRYPFCIRLSRFLILQMILLVVICFLFGTDINRYYYQCNKRSECYSDCNLETYPDLSCNPINTTIISGGNVYSNLFVFKKPAYSSDIGYSNCKGYLNDHKNFQASKSNSSRLERLDVCFNQSILGPSYSGEYLTCVMPLDSCEGLYLPNRVSGGGGDFDIGYAFIAIAIGNVFQYIYIFLLLYTIHLNNENIEEMGKRSWKCFMQIFMLVISTILILLVIWKASVIFTIGYAPELWITFAVAFSIDQCKSLVFHFCVWYFLLRRCGYLKVTEDEFVDEKWKIEKKDLFLINLRKNLQKLVDHIYYKNSSVALLIAYAIYVLLVLSIQNQLNSSQKVILDDIDQAFIGIFLLEIILNLFVSGPIKYYSDYFNVFDTSIVITSFVIFFFSLNARGLAVLRLLRLLRLLIVLRKVSSSQRRVSKYATALEETLTILKTLKGEKKLTFRQKKELGWAIEVIENNKLYDVSMDQKSDKGTGQQSQDAEAKKWIALATKSSNDPLQWFDRDLDDYLFERKRGNELGENKAMMEEEFKQHVVLETKAYYDLEKIFDDITKWRFDAFKFFEICGNQIISCMIFKLFNSYDITRKFEVPLASLKSFCSAIFEGYSSSNPYHNAIHAVDVTHRFNYFILSGNLMKYISDLDIMAALIAAIIHDFQHPGVNNEFLVKKKHNKAIRYNDESVLENHHLASAFAVLLDQNCDITIALTEDQYWVMRTSIIKMVFSTDLKYQEETIGSFKNYRGIPNFPNNDKEKQILMNMAMRISDFGNPTQPHDLYVKWMSMMMEEFYQQGDIEDHLGMEDTMPFMRRRETNPYACQLSYIEIIVEPMVVVWVEFLPDIREDVYTKGLLENKEIIKQKSEQIPKIDEEELEVSLSEKRRRR